MEQNAQLNRVAHYFDGSIPNPPPRGAKAVCGFVSQWPDPQPGTGPIGKCEDCMVQLAIQLITGKG